MTVVSEPAPIVYVKVLSLVTTVTLSVTPVPRGTVSLGLPGFELVGKGGALGPVPRGTDLVGAWVVLGPVRRRTDWVGAWVVLGPVLRGTGVEESGLAPDPVPTGVEMVLGRGVTDVRLLFDGL